MRKISRLTKFGLILAIILAGFTTVFPQDGGFSINESPLGAPTGFVNDYAGVIDAQTKQRLEEKLKNLKATTNPQVEIAVAVVNTTGERPIFDYSLAVARGWGIGSKQDDNPSALLFVAIDDRKYFTQVSKDLEDELPDGRVGSIQRQFLVPEFRKGNYAKGIEDTIDAYIQTIRDKQGGVFAPEKTPEKTGGGRTIGGLSGGSVCCIFIVIIVLLIIFSSRGGGRGGRGGGGGSGLTDALPWIILSGLASSGSSSSSSGWGSSGGDSSWGGGDWGGFGGGGDFGGGGAGGDW